MAKVRLGRASKDALAGALFVVFTILIACSRPAAAGGERASAPQTGYDPLAAFAPLSLPDPVTPYRSADGARGPAFWQNRADYLIRAHLDTITHTLSAEESIRYTNNSPSRLDCLWIHLDQNIYRSDSRARVINARELQGSNARELQGSTSGYTLDSVEIEHNGKRTPALTLISDTRLQIRLEQPLAPGGGKIGVLIRYHYTIPGEFGGRTAHAASRNGEIYDIAQWYPRMAVFDDLRGWDTLPYLGAEFYLEYGDFDYYVTVPADLLVAGSGELQNPEQVLTPLERSRLAQARDSDGTVMIRTAEEAGSAASTDATRTWHFRMHDTRDVAFAASRAFLWDAARIRLPDGKRSLAMSFYPVESAGAGAWGRSTEYLKDAVQNFSRRWAPYPYPTAVAVAGPVTGMEYPGMVFDGASESGKVLFWLTVHEIGHCWFPMMVGSNERRDQWIDEGFNTFIDVMESDDFDHGEFGPKRDAEYAPGGGNPADEILPILADPAAPILLTRADQVVEKYRHPVSYFKSAFGLVLLREQILGPERFDFAFRKFIRDWTFHHPSPSDFFRALQSAAGEDLSWFWRGWYFNNWTFDVAIEGVQPIEGDWHKGAEIAIRNRDPLVLPATVEVQLEDGSHRRIALAAESWIKSDTAYIRLDTQQAVRSVTVDPDHALPDRDRTNNEWKAVPGP